MQNVIYEAHELFKNTGFDYAICGGFAFDMYTGRTLRTHGDFDITVFKEDKHQAVNLLMGMGWQVYGRFMETGKPATNVLFYKVEDIAHSYWDDCINFWAIKPNCFPEMYKLPRLGGEVYSYKAGKFLVENLEFIELEVDTRENGEYVARDNPRIALPMEKAILYREGIPYLAPEVVLFYKSDRFSFETPSVRPKTLQDFETILPMLPAESKVWLQEAITKAYPDGCPWLEGIIM